MTQPAPGRSSPTGAVAPSPSRAVGRSTFAARQPGQVGMVRQLRLAAAEQIRDPLPRHSSGAGYRRHGVAGVSGLIDPLP